MRRRLVAAIVTLVAGIALAGCQTQPGTAAYVGAERITAPEIDRLVAATYDDPNGGAQLRDAGDAIRRAGTSVRQQVVQVVVLLRLLRRTADEVGVRVEQSDVDSLQATIAAQPLGGRPEEIQLVTPELGAQYWAYVQALGQHYQDDVTGPAAGDPTAAAAASQALTDAVRRQAEANPVRVNPRYGSFDIARLSLAG